MSITSHFLREEDQIVEYKCLNLETASWDPELKKTGPLIRAMIDKLADDWGINLKTTPFTVDGGWNVINAIRAEGSGLQDWGDVAPLPVYNCAAHKLNNCVRDVLSPSVTTNELSEVKVLQALEAAKNIARHSKQSSINSLLGPGKKLKQEVATRWNSHVIMLTSVINSWDDLTALSEKTRCQRKTRTHSATEPHGRCGHFIVKGT